MQKIRGIFLLSLFLISLVPFAAAAQGEVAVRVVGGTSITGAQVLEFQEGEDISDVVIEEVQSEEEQTRCVQRLLARYPRATLRLVREKCVLVAAGSDVDSSVRMQSADRMFAYRQKIAALVNDSDFAKYREDREFRARALTAQRLTRARDHLVLAQERFRQAQDNYEQAKTRIKDIRERRAACLTDEAGDACTEVKRDAQAFLTHAADVVLQHLESLAARIEGADSLSEEEAAALLAEVGDAIAEVEAIKVRIDALSEDASREQINALAQELRTIWQDVQQTVKRVAGHVVNARIGGIIVKSRHLEGRLATVLEKMAEQGKDIVVVEALVDAFGVSLDEAQAQYELGVQLFKDGEVQQAHETLRAAHQSLQQAHQTLQEIVQTLQQQGSAELLDGLKSQDEASGTSEDSVKDAED